MRPLPQRLVVDTGPLLLHAFGAFEQGRYLPRVAADIPSPDVFQVSNFLDRLFRAVLDVTVTPHVLSEFQAVAKARTRFTPDRLGVFLRFYSQQLLLTRHYSSSVEELVRGKQEFALWQLSFTDTSLVLAARSTGAAILSQDHELIGRCEALGLSALHPYYWYLESI